MKKSTSTFYKTVGMNGYLLDIPEKPYPLFFLYAALPKTEYQMTLTGNWGTYALAAETSITEGTWKAAQASAAIAQTGQEK